MTKAQEQAERERDWARGEVEGTRAVLDDWRTRALAAEGLLAEALVRFRDGEYDARKTLDLLARIDAHMKGGGR